MTECTYETCKTYHDDDDYINLNYTPKPIPYYYSDIIEDISGQIYVISENNNYIDIKIDQLYDLSYNDDTYKDFKLSTISTNVQQSITELNDHLESLNTAICCERAVNNSLKASLGINDQLINASNTRFSNYMSTHDIKYLKNWAIFLGIIAVLIAIKFTYNIQTVELPTKG